MACPPAGPTLIAITDTTVCAADMLLERAELLAAEAVPGSLCVMLRDRQLAARSRLQLGYALKQRLQRHSQLLSVNDRADLCVLVGADALHLPERGLEAADARAIVGSAVWLTAACHDPIHLQNASDSAMDAWLLSPIVAPRKGRPALGIESLRSLSAQSSVYALGGVSGATASACLTAGAAGVAVIGAAFSEPEPLGLLDALGIRRCR